MEGRGGDKEGVARSKESGSSVLGRYTGIGMGGDTDTPDRRRSTCSEQESSVEDMLSSTGREGNNGGNSKLTGGRTSICGRGASSIGFMSP